MKNYRFLYGPVPSRRLGRSLGVDIITYKYCTYDCIYCQSGKTTKKTTLRNSYISPDEILEEVERFLKEEAVPIDYISLSGSGEPTLHSGIKNIIDGIKKITEIPVAVITNGSLLYLDEVRQDLLSADVVLPSMDAVSAEIFEKINRPASDISLGMIINGLIEFRKIYKGEIWLEILFCKGVNDDENEVLRMLEVVRKINPDKIHLNTVVRPPSERWVKALTHEEMERIQALFGPKASIISEFDRHSSEILIEDTESEIIKILKRRPLSLMDLSKLTGIKERVLETMIEPMVSDGKIIKKNFGNSIFYEIPRE